MAIVGYMVKKASVVPGITERKGFLAGYMVDKVERYGAMAFFSYLKGYYREKAMWRGHGIDLWVGGGLTLLSGLAYALTGGKGLVGGLATHANAFGDAGMMSYIGSMAASYGAKKSGRQVYVLAPGATPPAQLPAGMTAVGATPPGGVGAYLSDADIARYCDKR